MKVHSFALTPREKDKIWIKNQLDTFYFREANIIKTIPYHISLMVCSLSPLAKKNLLKFLKENSLSLPLISAQVDNFKPLGNEYIMLSIKSPELLETHLKILEAVRPFTAGNFNSKYLKQNLSLKEIDYLYKYGYHRVKDLFKIHLTAGKYLTSEIRDQELEAAPKIKGKLTFDTLQLVEVEDGANTQGKILWQTKLGN